MFGCRLGGGGGGRGAGGVNGDGDGRKPRGAGGGCLSVGSPSVVCRLSVGCPSVRRHLIFLPLIIAPSIGGNFTPKTATEIGAQYVSPSSHSHTPKSDPRLRQPCSEASPIVGEKIKVAFSVIFVNKRQLFTEKPVR